jgi:AcrR family transcriptional regulator
MAGLRELKKQQTRRAIIDAALHLFAEHGFDQVPVARVARAAEVSEATVFNYFPAKEDLVHDGMDDFGASLVAAVRERPAGTSLVEAFRAALMSPQRLVDSPETVAQIVTAARIAADSPTLRARERQVYERCTRALADVIAEETGAAPFDVEPWVLANALMGVNRALKDLVHGMALAGHGGAEIAEAARVQGERGFALLESHPGSPNGM